MRTERRAIVSVLGGSIVEPASNRVQVFFQPRSVFSKLPKGFHKFDCRGEQQSPGRQIGENVLPLDRLIAPGLLVDEFANTKIVKFDVLIGQGLIGLEQQQPSRCKRFGGADRHGCDQSMQYATVYEAEIYCENFIVQMKCRDENCRMGIIIFLHQQLLVEVHDLGRLIGV